MWKFQNVLNQDLAILLVMLAGAVSVFRQIVFRKVGNGAHFRNVTSDMPNPSLRARTAAIVACNGVCGGVMGQQLRRLAGTGTWAPAPAALLY